MCKQLVVVLAMYQGLRTFTKVPPLWSVFLVGFAWFNFLLGCHISRYILQWEFFKSYYWQHLIEDVEEMKAKSHSDLKAWTQRQTVFNGWKGSQKKKQMLWAACHLSTSWGHNHRGSCALVKEHYFFLTPFWQNGILNEVRSESMVGNMTLVIANSWKIFYVIVKLVLINILLFALDLQAEITSKQWATLHLVQYQVDLPKNV